MLLRDYLNTIEKESNKMSESMKMQNLSFIMIFIAHATISDATKDIQKQLKKDK